MAKMILPTNFQDDIMNKSMNNKRRYQMIQNADGTVSFNDVTNYDQVGNEFGAGQINQTNAAVNESLDSSKVIDDMDDIVANTQPGMPAGALAVAQLNSDMSIALTYNPETDYFGMVYDGVWRDVLLANFQKHPVYLYNKGADNTDLIGNIVVSSMAFNRGSGAGKMKPNISRSSNRITFIQELNGSNYTQGSIWFSKAIDFTDYSTLNIHVLDSGSDATYIYLCKSYNAETSDDIRIMTINSVPADGLSADISTLGGNYYVAFSLLGSNCRITFDELWLE